MVENPSLSPYIQAFFNEALPKGKGRHVLALGENHKDAAGVEYIRMHLQTLRDAHGVGTIGFEFPPFMNVFLWAYEDGTLEKMLGSREHARTYLRHIYTAAKTDQETHNQTLELAMDAVDAGMRVVYFDARGTIFPYLAKGEKHTERLSQHTRDMRQNEADVAQELRVGKGNHYYLPRDIYWQMAELDYLLKEHPAYRARLAKMDKVIEQGMEKKIGSDGLSAVLLDAAAVPDKNMVTISGLRHVDTKGTAYHKHYNERVHGTFPDHLEWIGGGNVQVAVLAGETELRDIITKHHASSRADYAPSKRAKPMIGVDIERGYTTMFPEFPKHALGEMHDRFLDPWSLRDSSELIGQRVNPLLVPAIKQAAQAVRADWNPGLAQGMKR